MESDQPKNYKLTVVVSLVCLLLFVVGNTLLILEGLYLYKGLENRKNGPLYSNAEIVYLEGVVIRYSHGFKQKPEHFIVKDYKLGVVRLAVGHTKIKRGKWSNILRPGDSFRAEAVLRPRRITVDLFGKYKGYGVKKLYIGGELIADTGHPDARRNQTSSDEFSIIIWVVFSLILNVLLLFLIWVIRSVEPKIWIEYFRNKGAINKSSNSDTDGAGS